MNRGLVVVAALVIVSIVHGDAAARGTLRFGFLPLDLESSSETPLFGGEVESAVERYNDAAAAHDQMTGDKTERIDSSDLGLDATLFVIAPGIEAGTGRYFFRIEAPIGLASELRSIGVAIYPLNLQGRLSRNTSAYISTGGAASWLDRAGAGDIGGLVTLRAAAGVRFGRAVVELGYGAFVLGGSVNTDKLDSPQRMEAPSEAIAAGEARGIFDASIGMTFD